jgi:hypothetical protein
MAAQNTHKGKCKEDSDALDSGFTVNTKNANRKKSLRKQNTVRGKVFISMTVYLVSWDHDKHCVG